MSQDEVEYSERGAEMSQTETGKAVTAEERTEEAKSFVRKMKAATRHKHTSDPNVRVNVYLRVQVLRTNAGIRQSGV